MKFFDLENEFSGYEQFYLIGKNKKDMMRFRGCEIKYVLSRDYDEYRGYYNIGSGIIDELFYSRLLFEDGNEIDRRDVLECIIKKPPVITPQ